MNKGILTLSRRRQTPQAPLASPWLRWGLVAVVLGGFATLIGYATHYQHELNRSADTLPVIMPPQTPVKTRPENPGGREIAHQDKQVFNLLQKPANADLKDVKVPAPEPKIKPAPLPSAPSQMASAPQIPDAPVEPSAPLDEIAAKITAALSGEPAAPASQEPQTPPPPAPTAPVTAQGTFGVQLASYRSTDAAQNGANVFKKKFHSLLTPLQPDVQRVEIANKGTYYRLRFMGLETSNAALALCNSLKQQSQSCLVVKK